MFSEYKFYNQDKYILSNIKISVFKQSSNVFKLYYSNISFNYILSTFDLPTARGNLTQVMYNKLTVLPALRGIRLYACQHVYLFQS